VLIIKINRLIMFRRTVDISETTAHVNTLCGKMQNFLMLSTCQIPLPLVLKRVRGLYFIGSAWTIGVCRDGLNPRAVCYSFVTAAINLPLSTHICRVVLWPLCQMFVCVGIFFQHVSTSTSLLKI